MKNANIQYTDTTNQGEMGGRGGREKGGKRERPEVLPPQR
jgi:hypothetical protein